MSRKDEALRFLDEAGISYTIREHDPVDTIADMEALGLDKEGHICKNLFLRDMKGKKHFLVVMSKDKQANLKGLAGALKSTKLSFASDKRLAKYLGLAPGGVSPLGVINDVNHEVHVVFDNDLPKHPIVGIHPNDNRATLYLAFKDLEKIIREQGNTISFVTVL
ncbi:MAG: prolyl-tRNA editing protein proX [Dethiosulfovibrio peptidovorans]|nr:MAG: prolyl-tRNA editing protein proX [Dethiosulfovibrio peptidovorans]